MRVLKKVDALFELAKLPLDPKEYNELLMACEPLHAHGLDLLNFYKAISEN